MKKTGLGWLAREAWSLFLITSATLCFSVSVRCFYMPNHLLSGGVTGMALFVNALTKLPVGFMVLLFNIPIFLLGFRDVGRRFAAYSGLSVFLFWLMTDHLPLEPLTHEPLLGAMFGGIISGLGSFLALRSGGSGAGFDILGVILNRRFSLGVGEALLVLNGALVIASGILDNPEIAMYTLVAIYAGSRTLDALQSPRPRKAALIFSHRSRLIKERIIKEMARGATILKAEGAYTGEEMDVLLCVITQFEMKEMRDIVKDEDPEAFVTVLEASEVVGRFKQPTAFTLWKRQMGKE